MDDRAEREAKADILADQARRLSNEANLLEGRLTTLRTRNELKRRSGQLERDPFAPLEQVKTRVAVTGTSGGHSTFLPPPPDSSKTAQPGRGVTSTPSTSGNGAGAGAAPGGTATPPTITPGGGVLTVMPAPSPIAPADPGAGSLAGQLRGVLDPASLEEVRRLETPGAGPANLQVMERALAALRGRAAQLSAASTALRSRPANP